MSTQQQSAPAQERGALVIRRAIEIMRAGHHGWSWALAKAKAEIK
jgi:hypothetical protein